MPDPGQADVVLLGSGIYSHKVLPAISDYVHRWKDALVPVRTAVFGVAIDTTGVFVRGKVHGGWNYILPLIELLPRPPLHAALLGGEINPLRLDEADQKGLRQFYRMIGHGDTIPFKTKMAKQPAWDFAEKVMEYLAREEPR